MIFEFYNELINTIVEKDFNKLKKYNRNADKILNKLFLNNLLGYQKGGSNQETINELTDNLKILNEKILLLMKSLESIILAFEDTHNENYVIDFYSLREKLIQIKDILNINNDNDNNNTNDINNDDDNNF